MILPQDLKPRRRHLTPAPPPKPRVVRFGVPWGDGRWVCGCDGSRPGQPAVTLRPADLPVCEACGAVRPAAGDHTAYRLFRGRDRE